MTGPRIGRYRIDGTLGGGGMALVHRAWDERLDRPVALKLLADNLAADESFRARFLREARLAARLDHPNVVRVLDAGEAEGRSYIAMELVDGPSLAQVLDERGRIEPREAVEIGEQVCAGLAHAHAAGLVHRDVKPGNLLVAADGAVKIADFGIARATASTALTETGALLGTAAYLAPEQATGGPIGPGTDLYALGTVLYELVTGSPPFGRQTTAEAIARAHQHARAPRLCEIAAGVPAALDEAVARCLEPDPRDRPPSADTVRALLAGHGTASAPRVLLPRRRFRRGRGRRAALALGTLAAASTLVAVTAVWTGDDEAPPPREPAVPGDARAQARALAAWLRAHAEAG